MDARNPNASVTRFVMIASPRTGSTYLGRLLNNHPEIRFHGESFKPGKVPLLVREMPKQELGELKAELLEVRARDPLDYLERLYSLTDGRPIVGFKLAPSHDPEVLERLLADSSVLKIVHMRMNSLARWASRRSARQAGSFSQSAEKPKVLFDAKLFLEDHNKYVAIYDAAVRRLSRTRQPFLVTRYDEINNAAMIASLYKFLGTTLPPPDEVPTETGARAPSHILARFSNPDEVEAFVRRNNLMHWIYEGDTLFKPLSS